jgi:hypothetical protein
MADELIQVDVTPAPADGATQPEKVEAPVQPDYSWLPQDPETLDWMKNKGVHGYKAWNKENMVLKEKQAKLDAALSRLSEKPRSEPDPMPALKGRLQNLVEKGKLTLEEANAEYYAEMELQKQPKALTEDKLEEVLSKRETEKEMRAAEKEIAKASNGKLDEDDSFAMLNGYIAQGMSVDDAREKILGFFSGLSQEVDKAAKEKVTKVLTPPQTPKVITPGVTTAPGVPGESSVSEMTRQVIEYAKKRANKEE